MQAPAYVTKEDVGSVLEPVASSKAEITKLPNGNAYKHYIERSKDSGHNITIYYWSLAQIIEPSHARIANFSYTIHSDQEASNQIKAELQFLTKEIENAIFYPSISNGI